MIRSTLRLRGSGPSRQRIPVFRMVAAMGLLLLVLVLGTPWMAVGGEGTVVPANPSANQRVREVLSFFHGLEQRGEKRIVSGQFSNFGGGASLRIMESIHEKTGHWPALIGVDYANFSTGGLTWEAPNKAAIEYWKQGGLVSVSAHLYNPANTNGGGLRDKDVNLADLLKEGTDTHARWMRELDELATGLAGLKKAGVVVLWRPFHEMNGGWFWWGDRDPETFIRVWRHMFTYFSREKQLDNLIWVYGPNHGKNTAKFYAGDEYVDMVGLDAYTDFLDPQHVRGYDDVAAIRKPFGFTEYGPHGSQNPPGDYDYRKFLDGVTRNFPRTTLFMSWNAKWSLATNQFTAELLSDPRICNREDLPPGLTHPEL